MIDHQSHVGHVYGIITVQVPQMGDGIEVGAEGSDGHIATGIVERVVGSEVEHRPFFAVGAVGRVEAIEYGPKAILV